MKTIDQIRKLIFEECANFQRLGPLRIRNYCWMKEKSNAGVCINFTDEKARCSHFEQAVLPLNEDLREELEERNNAGIEDRAIDSGSRSIEGPESKPGNPPKVSVKRVSLDQHRGEGLLSRTQLHGVASQNPEKGC